MLKQLFTAVKKFEHPYDPFVRIFLPFIPSAVRPNHLTAIRFFFTPVVGYWLATESYLAGLSLFVLLSLTDMFDGALARARRQITNFGIIADPVADKFLILTVVFILLLKVNPWLSFAVFFVEFSAVLGIFIFRMFVPTVHLASTFWSKVKFNLQVLAVILLFFGLIFAVPSLLVAAEFLFVLAILFALVNAVAKVWE
jgi:cardiolipin synthase